MLVERLFMMSCASWVGLLLPRLRRRVKIAANLLENSAILKKYRFISYNPG